MLMRRMLSTQAPRRRGFTLIEILVVVAIIVILAGAATMVYMRYLEDAKRDTSYHKIKQLEEAAEIYYARNSTFPPSLEEFVNPSDGRGSYVEQEGLVDAWGKPFSYDPAGPNHGGTKPDIWTIDSKGQEIRNW